MTPERATAAVEMLAVVREDIAADVERLEGAPFTGRNVSEAIGNLAAQVDALARVLTEILTDHRGEGQP